MISRMDITRYKKETAFLPQLSGVEAVFLSGSQAQGRAHKNSDIDLFIITKPGQIWTARFCVYAYLCLSGKMRRVGKEAGKYCPNHFITSDHLEIQEKDPYSAHLFSHNIPLHDKNNIFVQFKKANQEWIESFGESFTYKLTQQDLNTAQTDALPRRGSWRGYIEKLLKHFQITKIKRHPDYNLPKAKITLTDTELRFHARPRNIEWKKQ